MILYLELFNGTIKTGIGGAVTEMSDPNHLNDWEELTGLKIIPGTLNIQLAKPFDLALLKYISFSEIDWDFSPSAQGFNFSGEVGMFYHPITIAKKYPGVIVFWTWVPEINFHAELVSPVHLRTTIGLEDGDSIEFVLNKKP
jgi:CTP-dependent riboflavin kinase